MPPSTLAPGRAVAAASVTAVKKTPSRLRVALSAATVSAETTPLMVRPWLLSPV